MKVLRLENENQDGVFSCFKVSGHSNGHPIEMPSPQREGLNMTHDHYCGFESLEQLRRWFPDRADDYKLTHKGVLLSTYEVDDSYAQCGKEQVIFLLDYAHKVDRQPLENYHDQQTLNTIHPNP